MKLNKIHHIGIAVSDLELAKAFYTKALGLRVEREEVLEGMKIAFIPVGEVNLELIQSTMEESVIAKFIAKRGDGVHHIAYEVQDIASALEELKALGVRLVDETPRRGANEKEVGFVHPKSSSGVLTELVGSKTVKQETEGQ